MFEGPEKKFQRHIADYFIREHKYALLEQDEIIDTEYYFAEDHLIAFLKATQKEAFKIKTVLSSFLKRCFHPQKSGSKAEKPPCLEPLSYNII